MVQAPLPNSAAAWPQPLIPEDLEVKLDCFLCVPEVRDCEPKATPELWEREGRQVF